MLLTTSKKYRQSTHAEQGKYTRASRGPRPARPPGSSNAELIKRALLLPRFFSPPPDFPHLHRLFAVTYSEDHGSIRTKTALADGARVCSDAHEAAARGERVHADRVCVWRWGGLGYVWHAITRMPRKAVRAEQLPRVR